MQRSAVFGDSSALEHTVGLIGAAMGDSSEVTYSKEAEAEVNRKELRQHIAAKLPVVAFHVYGRLPDSISEDDVKEVAQQVEEQAFALTQDIKDPAARKQAHLTTASRLLLQKVLEHCPADADPTASSGLHAPSLEPASQSPHVARPPMDPRFDAASPFAALTTQPVTAKRRCATLMDEDTMPVPELRSESATRMNAARRISTEEGEARLPSLGPASPHAVMRWARNSSVGLESSSSGPMPSIRRQMSLTLRQDSGLMLSMGSLRGSIGPGRAFRDLIANGAVWGWLESSRDSEMPGVLLRGSGIAIGRSREAFEARRHALSLASSETGAIQDPSPSRRLAEVLAKALGFLEIADGRVSRLHCMIHAEPSLNMPVLSSRGAPAVIEDCSANGTFVNGVRLAKGERRPLNAGDRLSLVLSLTPMVEKSFTFWLGDPREGGEPEDGNWADTSSSACCAIALGASEQATTVDKEIEAAETPKGYPPLVKTISSRHGLKRMATSRYTTADSSEPGDMMCQICLGPLRACLALQPCGHNFCAACLSHHFASLLQGGQPLTCPLRCAAPERIVTNPAMRALVDREFPQQRHRSVHADGRKLEAIPSMTSTVPSLEQPPWQRFDRARFERDRLAGGKPNRVPDLTSALTEPLTDGNDASHGGDTDAEEGSAKSDGNDEGELTEMSTLCPLWEDMLPLDATSLKTKQVEIALRDLEHKELDRLVSALETLARLSWSDDEVRAAIAAGSGIEAVVKLMGAWTKEPGLLCNACLCLMSLVRGEGAACEANQWQVAKAGGVEAVVNSMKAFPHNALVQLSALLCIIPLALDNSTLQAHVATLAMPAVVSSLRVHAASADVQAKGLVVLGVLGQGEDAVHDAIRQQQLSVGATGRILAALERWGAQNEEVLWAILFSLAVLVRDGQEPFQPAVRAVAAAGIPPLLTAALTAYKEEADDNADEMIITAGDYLMKTLEPAAAMAERTRFSMVGLAMAPLVAASALWSRRSASTNASSSQP